MPLPLPMPTHGGTYVRDAKTGELSVVTELPSPPAAPGAEVEPEAGGSYIRDPKTGELTAATEHEEQTP